MGGPRGGARGAFFVGDRSSSAVLSWGRRWAEFGGPRVARRSLKETFLVKAGTMAPYLRHRKRAFIGVLKERERERGAVEKEADEREERKKKQNGIESNVTCKRKPLEKITKRHRQQ